MRFEQFMDDLRDGRWLLPVSIGIGVVALAVVLVAAWPAIKPKPRGQYQSLTTIVTTSGADSDVVQPPSQAIKEEIMADLGVEDASRVSVAWGNEEQNEVSVSVMKGATDWTRYTYVIVDGAWKQK